MNISKVKQIIKDITSNLNCRLGFCKGCKKRFNSNIKKLNKEIKKGEEDDK